ncbi:MAG TPA: hypothetical protein VHZ03_32810, partial [Trebonia sp.]|nr:hypothetical protein [Trebonia sp.]
KDNPARKVDKPRRLPSTRRAVADTRLAEINQVAATTGDDPELDTLILRLHTETACRRGGALALRPADLDRQQCLILLREKGETVLRDAVPVRVTDLVVRPAEHVQQAHQPDIDADLLAGFPDRGGGRRLARLNGAAEDSPPVVMAGMPDQQNSPCLIHRQHRYRRQQQQLMPDNGPQLGYMRSDTHRATLRP